jgi:hypothetical protein
VSRFAILGKARLRPVALGVLVASLAGCMETRYYPLCVYAGSATFIGNPRLYEDVAQFARDVGGQGSEARTSTNRRAVAVRAPLPRHRALAAGWPQVGCIGPTDRAEHIDDYRACIAMMQRSLSEGRPPPLEFGSDGTGQEILYCTQGDSFSDDGSAMPMGLAAPSDRGVHLATRGE